MAKESLRQLRRKNRLEIEKENRKLVVELTNKGIEVLGKTISVAGDIAKISVANPVLGYLIGWFGVDIAEKASYSNWLRDHNQDPDKWPFMDPATANGLKQGASALAGIYAAAPIAAAALPGLMALKSKD